MSTDKRSVNPILIGLLCVIIVGAIGAFIKFNQKPDQSLILRDKIRQSFIYSQRSDLLEDSVEWNNARLNALIKVTNGDLTAINEYLRHKENNESDTLLADAEKAYNFLIELEYDVISYYETKAIESRAVDLFRNYLKFSKMNRDIARSITKGPLSKFELEQWRDAANNLQRDRERLIVELKLRESAH